jgi:integrase
MTGKYSLNQILDRFEQDYVPTLAMRSQRDYARHIKLLRSEFGHLDPTKISDEQYSRFLGVSSGRVSRTKSLSVLRSALGIARREWRWLPSDSVPRLPRSKPRRAAALVTDADFNEVRAQFSQPFQNAIDLALITGHGIGDILSARWSHVQTDRMLFPNARNPSTREIAITPRLRRVLERCGTSDSLEQFVIRSRKGTRYTNEGFRAIWQRAMRKRVSEGKNRFTFHDIRAKARQTHAYSVPADIQDAVDRTAETQDVEFKDWLDIGDPVNRAEIAKDLAALANFGGGYLIFGIADDGSPSSLPPLSIDTLSNDQIASIIERYLVPRFQCEVFAARPARGGDVCVVVRVPSHGVVPICACRDGPQVDGKFYGVRIGRYYTRAPQPRSVPIESPEQWKEIIRRCVVKEREILLSEIDRLISSR